MEYSIAAYLGSKGVVVVLPRETGLDVAAGVQRLAGFDHLLWCQISAVRKSIQDETFEYRISVPGVTYVEVLRVNVAMLGKVVVLLGHEHTLCSMKQTISATKS